MSSGKVWLRFCNVMVMCVTVPTTPETVAVEGELAAFVGGAALSLIVVLERLQNDVITPDGAARELFTPIALRDAIATTRTSCVRIEDRRLRSLTAVARYFGVHVRSMTASPRVSRPRE